MNRVPTAGIFATLCNYYIGFLPNFPYCFLKVIFCYIFNLVKCQGVALSLWCVTLVYASGLGFVSESVFHCTKLTWFVESCQCYP